MDNIDNQSDPEVSQDVEEFAADVKRGARRVRSAVRRGAKEVAKAARPSFGEQLGDAVRSLGTDPSESPRLFMEVVRDHPAASLTSAAAIALIAQRFLWGRR